MPTPDQERFLKKLDSLGRGSSRLITQENEPGIVTELIVRCQKAGIELPLIGEFSSEKPDCGANYIFNRIAYSSTMRRIMNDAEMIEVLSHELIHIRDGVKQITRQHFLTGAGVLFGAMTSFSPKTFWGKLIGPGTGLAAGWTLGRRLAEVDADRGAILEFGGNPDALVRALQKFSEFEARRAAGNGAVTLPLDVAIYGTTKTRQNRVRKAGEERDKKDISR